MTGAGPVATQRIMVNRRRAVDDALGTLNIASSTRPTNPLYLTASTSFSPYTSHPTLAISEVVQTISTTAYDRLILEPTMPYPITTLTSLFAMTGPPSFDPNSVDARIQKAVRGGRLQGTRTLPLWSAFEECQAFIE